MKLPSFSLFRRLFRQETGATAAIFAIASFALIGMTAAVFEMSRMTAARTRAQGALDAAALAATVSADRLNVQAEADGFFQGNFSAGSFGANFDPVTVVQNGDRYTFSVNGRMPYLIAQAMGDLGLDFGREANIRLTSTTQRGRLDTPTEVSMVLDVSNYMKEDDRVGKMRDAAKTMIESIYGDKKTISNLTFSTIPYADAVRFPKERANGWLGYPYGNTNRYDGCLGLRSNDPNIQNTLDTTSDAAPKQNDPCTVTSGKCAAEGFDLYKGPYGHFDAFQVHYFGLGTNGDGRSSVTKFKTTIAGPNVNPSADNWSISFSDLNPATNPNAGSFYQYMFGDPSKADRFSSMLDYMNNGKSEFLAYQFGVQQLISEVQFGVTALTAGLWADSFRDGDPYPAGPFLDKKQICQPDDYAGTWPAVEDWCCDRIEYEDYKLYQAAGWGGLNEKDEVVKTTRIDTFETGWPKAPLTGPCTTPAGCAWASPTGNNSKVPGEVNQIHIYPLNSYCYLPYPPGTNNPCNTPKKRTLLYLNACGHHQYKYDDGWYTPVHDGQSIHWNSSLGVTGFFFVPRCSVEGGVGVPQTTLFMSNKDSILAKLDILKSENASGYTRSNIGIAWGWYALSPNWRSIIEPAKTDFPRDYGNARKIIILMTQGKNFNNNGEKLTRSPQTSTDDADFVNVCSTIRSKGIEIYTVGVNVKEAAAHSKLVNCAGDYTHAFNTDGSTEALSEAMRNIARGIIQVRLVR